MDLEVCVWEGVSGEMEPRVTGGGERYGRRRDTERKKGIGVGRGGREREGWMEGGREGGGPSWRERSQRERKGEKSFPESSLVDFSVHCFPQPAELTPNKGRRGGVFFFF